MDRVVFNNLVAKAIAGDKDAMQTVIAESYEDIQFYARKILKDEDLAADAAQDSCVEIIESIGKLRSSAAFVTWSRCIVYHQCISRVNHSEEVCLDADEDGETLLDRLPDTDPSSLPEEVVQNHELRDLLLGMIDNLPPEQRSALLLYHCNHYSIKEISQIQGENENTIKTRLRLGRIDVQNQVAAYEKKTGIKLHSVGIAPLLYYLLQVGKEESSLAAAAQLPGVLSALAPVITKAAAGAAVGSVAGAAVTSTLAFKIGVAVVTVALAVGGLVAVTQQQDSEPTEDPAPDISYSEPSQPDNPTPPTSAPDSSHPFQHYAFDNDGHWLICDCPDATDTRYAHSFANGECSVCRMPEPLPGGNPYLTYDTTILGGHWLSMPINTSGDAADEFYINGDGSLYINGTTYYPVGSKLGDAPVGEPCPLLLYFRETPYDPEMGITEMEAYSAPVILESKSADDLTVINLSIIGTDIYINSSYYRESDYFGYEKVALTPENFRNYLTITIDPISCGYSYGTFYANTGIQFTLKEGLGAASCCVIEGSILAEKHIISSNIQTQDHDLNDIPFGEETTNLRTSFYGTSYNKFIQIMSGETVPINNVVEWYGYIPKDVEITSVSGYIFVPKQ